MKISGNVEIKTTIDEDGTVNEVSTVSGNPILAKAAMDAVKRADSGHPGTAMALAPLAYVLWQRHLRYNPANPDWFGRDRFVLSAGHACVLLYAVLYLTGYDLSLDDLKQFRQWGSRTPGHSEHGLTPGRQRLKQLIQLGKRYEAEHGLQVVKPRRRRKGDAWQEFLSALARVIKVIGEQDVPPVHRRGRRAGARVRAQA